MSEPALNKICKADENGNVYYDTSSGKFPVQVREAKQDDLESIVNLKNEAFSTHNEYNYQWILSNWNRPEQKCSRWYVITYSREDGQESQVIGFIFWRIRAGFEVRLTVELDQIAVDKSYRRQGFATTLIRRSLIKFQEFTQANFSSLKPRISFVFVITGEQNPSQELYKKTLGLERKGKIGAIFGASGEKIIMANENIEQFLDDSHNTQY
ncbi:unnamed protein product [Rotaria sp. Silwood2]|nr:unnamed protein product [Rotaria sp. Silwood2]CAF2897066.1 unnamed protein product [Rotaria sp. Silwood2]CAF3441116.1 unnamed protein product [Rotaria sp. Silwood2]CAF4344604.1 unnamed protein product [Rotaria sp. Silwood2]CAF4384169.1 unnamed protein product [Rotaria sp. Silwood2]